VTGISILRKGFSHGMATVNHNVINADLLAFSRR